MGLSVVWIVLRAMVSRLAVLSTMNWGELIAGALSGGLLTKVLDWTAKRGRTQAYTMGAVDHAVSTAMGLVTTRLERVEGQHAECERNLQGVREDLDRTKQMTARERDELKAEIARLMAGQIARPGQEAPRDA